MYTTGLENTRISSGTCQAPGVSGTLGTLFIAGS
jgi:hypothetical protein